MSSQETMPINTELVQTVQLLVLDVNKLKADISQIKSAIKSVFSTIQENQEENVVCIFCMKKQQWCKVGHYLCLDCDDAHIKTNYACDLYVNSRDCSAHNTKLAYKEDFDGY